MAKYNTFELKIEKRRFPKRKNNNAFNYANKISRDIRKLHDLEWSIEVKYITLDNGFKLIKKRSKKSRASNPLYQLSLINNNLIEIDNHYEHFCLQIFALRESLWKFVREFLDIKAKTWNDFNNDSKIRELKIDLILKNFSRGSLKKLITYRNKLTHEFTPSQDIQKVDEIIKQLRKKITDVSNSLDKVLDIKESIEKILSKNNKNNDANIN